MAVAAMRDTLTAMPAVELRMGAQTAVSDGLARMLTHALLLTS